MSHITDQMASWETPASEHTGGRDGGWGGGGGVFRGCGETCNLKCFNRTGEACWGMCLNKYNYFL